MGDLLIKPPCGHTFHEDCIRNWSRRACPTCRTPIPEILVTQHHHYNILPNFCISPTYIQICLNIFCCALPPVFIFLWFDFLYKILMEQHHVDVLITSFLLWSMTIYVMNVLFRICEGGHTSHARDL